MYDVLNISQMAARYQVSYRTLRFYEQRGLLRPVRNPVGRLYTSRDRMRLELILKGRKLGFTLLEIAELVASAPSPHALEAGDVTSRLTPEQMKAKLTHLESQREAVETGLVELRRALAASEAGPRRLPVQRTE